MIPPPELVRRISDRLREEGLTFEEPSDPTWQWSLVFDIEGKAQDVFAFVPDGDPEYLYIYSPLKSGKLENKSLDQLPDSVLRTLIQIPSDVVLAKLIFAQPGFYLAVTESSVHELTAPKLRRRLEAVASLAAKLDLALV